MPRPRRSCATTICKDCGRLVSGNGVCYCNRDRTAIYRAKAARRKADVQPLSLVLPYDDRLDEYQTIGNYRQFFFVNFRTPELVDEQTLRDRWEDRLRTFIADRDALREAIGRPITMEEFPARVCPLRKGVKKCQRITFVTKPYCAECTDRLYGLAVKKSTIPGAGAGLFSTRHIEKDEFITKYSGKSMSKAHWTRFVCTAPPEEVRKAKKYALYNHGADSSEYIIVSDTSNGGVGRYINDPRDSSRANCYTVDQVCRQSVEIFASRPIQPGEELFISYGNSYWDDNQTEQPSMLLLDKEQSGEDSDNSEEDSTYDESAETQLKQAKVRNKKNPYPRQPRSVTAATQKILDECFGGSDGELTEFSDESDREATSQDNNGRYAKRRAQRKAAAKTVTYREPASDDEAFVIGPPTPKRAKTGTQPGTAMNRTGQATTPMTGEWTPANNTFAPVSPPRETGSNTSAQDEIQEQQQQPNKATLPSFSAIYDGVLAGRSKPANVKSTKSATDPQAYTSKSAALGRRQSGRSIPVQPYIGICNCGCGRPVQEVADLMRIPKRDRRKIASEKNKVPPKPAAELYNGPTPPFPNVTPPPPLPQCVPTGAMPHPSSSYPYPTYHEYSACNTSYNSSISTAMYDVYGNQLPFYEQPAPYPFYAQPTAPKHGPSQNVESAIVPQATYTSYEAYWAAYNAAYNVSYPMPNTAAYQQYYPSNGVFKGWA